VTARLLDGAALAKSWNQALAVEIRAFPRPIGLAVVLVGADPGSEVYVRRKGEVAHRLGLHHRQVNLPADATLPQILAVVDSLNADDAIDGILVQLPLPGGLDGRVVTERIHPDKDVDGLTTLNAGSLAQGRPRLVPCTPLGVMRLLAASEIPVEGREVVVIGRSNLFGRPMAMLLEQANATVTLAHSRSRDLPAVARRAEVLVVAVGRPRMVGADWVREGATVVDVGINRLADGTIAGDVDQNAVSEKVAALTPVPGGIGPTTIAMLMANTVRAARLRAGV
jgi:methylenetetrahydrofolate dehydrogenase (NADP+)/methenyltetrahydrofolate cyclohydrolase